MQFLTKTKDGGPESPVDGYFLIEIKSLFSIALLKFNEGRREQFHTHAFHALTWFIKGELTEEKVDGTRSIYKKSLWPKFTSKANNHRVIATKDSWCFTIRGPWAKTWTETDKKAKTCTTFEWGRKILKKGTNLLTKDYTHENLMNMLEYIDAELERSKRDFNKSEYTILSAPGQIVLKYRQELKALKGTILQCLMEDFDEAQ